MFLSLLFSSLKSDKKNNLTKGEYFVKMDIREDGGLIWNNIRYCISPRSPNKRKKLNF